MRKRSSLQGGCEIKMEEKLGSQATERIGFSLYLQGKLLAEQDFTQTWRLKASEAQERLKW